MGNGAKAQQKRERNKKDAKKAPSSQLKTNIQSKQIACQWCKTMFMKTMSREQLTAHAEKDKKTFEFCFPDWEPPK